MHLFLRWSWCIDDHKNSAEALLPDEPVLSWDKEFKKKWLSEGVRTDRLGKIINGKVEELREELLKMLGVVGFDSEDE